MTQVGRLHLDPTSYRLDRRFFRRIWQLSKPYWSRQDAWRSWIALGTLLGSVVAYSLFGAWASFVLKRQTDALLGHHQPLFWGLLGLQAAILSGRVGISMAQGFISGRMVLHWRRWLTVYLVDRYLARRTYYEIALDHRIDNPDQRIQEETGIFCTYMAGIPQQVFGTFVDIGVQSVVIATIAPSLMWGIFLFAAVKTAVMISVYIPSIRKNFELTVSEADLRYGLLHVRDNAETVAFYRGEYAENRHLIGRLGTVIAKQKALIMYYVPVTGVILGFDVIWMVLPLLLLAPQFFAHHVAYGAIAQATFAGTQIMLALTVFSQSVPLLTAAAPRAIRLAEIQEKFEALERDRHPTAGREQISFLDSPEIRLEKVSIETPGGEQSLVRDIDLRIAAGDHLVILGQTGVGKSSLLRAMAGLWGRGGGSIQMPPADQMLFLPQRPYMILADLRSQIVYPTNRSDISDAGLQAILERVSLPNLAAQHGGFAAEKDWAKVLSLGEQQRLAFARVLVAHPKYVFLDEATSAVDLGTERLLYDLLAASGATFVSVSHRESILRRHRKALRLLAGGGWEILAASEVALSPVD